MNGQEKSAVDSVVCFGACRLDRSNVQVWRDGHEVKLTGKAFAVLCHFVQHPGQLVTKDDLFAAAWPETVVSDATLASCIQEIRQALGDDAKRPRYIETVHRRGFRFIAPLNPAPPVPGSKFKVQSENDNQDNQEVTGGELGSLDEAQRNPGETPETESRIALRSIRATELPPVEAPPLPQSAPTPRRFRWWQVPVLIVLLILGGGLAANWRLVRLVAASYFPPPVPEPIALPLPDKPSLVVLPLVNLSGDASQEYFSDGITDDLINTLAQFPDLFVIARHSAFTYKGKTVKEQEVGRELGVRYVLTGSVRRAGEQVRMNVQLVDATTGEHLWVEQYDRPFTEIFALQDDLVQKLATTLKVQLSVWTNGLSFRKTTKNVEAYDYDLRGLKQYLGLTKSDNLQARTFFETALTLDPQYAQAYANIGFTYYTEWVMKWSTDPQTLERALEYGQKAVALGDFYGLGHTVLALVYVQKAQIDRGLSEMEQAMTLQPNLAIIHRNRADVLLFAGRPGEALQAVQQAIRLSPHGPFNAFFTLGWAYQHTAQYAESIVALKRALALNSFYPPVYSLQAFNYAAQWIIQQSDDPKILGLAYDAAQNAIALYETFPLAHAALGSVYLLQKLYDDAIAAFERAVALDENFVCGQMLLAGGLSQVGRVEEAVRVGERALSLKALPSDDRCLFGIADAYVLAGRLEEAAALQQRMLKQFPDVLGSHLALAAIYSELGRETEARAAAAEVLRINPQFSLEVHKQRMPLKDPAMLERHVAALRKAGLK